MRRYEDGAGTGRDDESMSDRMKHRAEDAGDHAKQRARETAEEARAKANEMYESAQTYVNDLLDEQKGRVSGCIGSVSSAIRAASEKLREDEMQPADGWVDRVADQVDAAREYVDEQEALAMLGEVRSLAKRYPYVLVGAAFVTGVGIARFLKASQQHRDSGAYERGETPDSFYGAAGTTEAEFRADRGPSAPRQTPTTPPTPTTGQAPPQSLQSEPRPTSYPHEQE